MTTLFLILLPLVISSLGFLTYKHPPIARQILKPLLYLSIGLFSFLQIVDLINSSAYYKSITVTKNIAINYPKSNHLNIDSLYKNIKDRDSIYFIINDNKYQSEKAYDIYLNQTEIRDTITNHIETLLQTS